MSNAIADGVTSAPHDREAEQSVLGAILLDGGCIHQLTFLAPRDFYEERHQHVFEAARALAAKGEPIDILTLRVELDHMGALSRCGGIDYIAALSIITPTATSVVYYAKIVHDLALRRRVLAAAVELRHIAESDNIDVDQVVGLAEKAVTDAVISRRRERAATAKTMINDFAVYLERVTNSTGTVTGVATGYPTLDEMTGGFQPDDLILLAARPSIGKTSMALNIARNVAMSGKFVVLFSLEMSQAALTHRLVSGEAGVDGWALRHPSRLTPEEFSNVLKSMDRLSQARMVVDDGVPLNYPTLLSECRRLDAIHGLDLVVVDYLGLMDPPDPRAPRVNQVGDISKGLKMVAKELHVPVLALSQLSRESERADRAPELHDLRDSGNLEQDSDVVMFLHRPKDQNEKDHCRVDLIVRKHRNGPVGTVPMVFLKAQTMFREMASNGP